MKSTKFDQLVESVMTGKTIFAEGKSSAKAKYFDKLSSDKAKAEEIFNKLLALDTTMNKRYVEWMAKMVVENPNLDLERFKVISDYQKLNIEGKLTPEQKDFVNFAKLEDMEKIVAEVGSKLSKTAVEKGKLAIGGKVPEELKRLLFWEGANSFVLKPETKEDSQKFGNEGSGNTWCLASSDAAHNAWDQYYYERAGNVYFIYPFDPSKFPKNYLKICVVAFPDGKTEFWDYVNHGMSQTEIDEVIAKLGDESWK
jgi:hypothetical protein